ncbi:protein LYK5-like [Durio zibethinus]|uniref:Protein LYK5-like n=1 Tax=Durio zibethinus TaxID=66656 RepID=A0A6P5WT24_DURZI|nr:protein LYK5-like [Durio zibethinus]
MHNWVPVPKTLPIKNTPFLISSGSYLHLRTKNQIFSMAKLKPWQKFYFPFLLLPLLFLLGFTQAQQGYVNNQQLDCENPSKDNNITRGYSCNGERRSCQSYIIFRSEPPYYNTAVSIAYLLGAQATQISSINNLSADITAITPKSMVVVPVNCSCFSGSSGSYYQHNASYSIKFPSETYFSISNDTYQGLTTCQAMKAQNPIDYRELKVGDELVVPIRCACPTLRQIQAGAKYLLSYIVAWGDSYSSIAKTFGADEKSILDANELSEDDIIFPFTPLLVPLSNEPTNIELPQTSPPPAPATQIPTVPVGESKSSKKWVFIGVGIGVGSLLLLGLAGFLFCFYRRQRQTHEARPIASPPPKPPSNLKPFPDSANYTGNSWSVSISSQGVRYAIESLTPYKYEDLKAATGNFSESNRIKGSVFRGSFQGDDAAVKVMKGDVSSEINLLKKINHTNIIRLSGFCVHEGNTYLVYEYADKGSVSDWLHSNKLQTSYTLSWKQRVQIAYDIADALNYLHNYINPPHIHKNLKTSNILLDVNFRAKVANFGLARTIEHNNEGGMQLTRHVVGTQGYMAPEYIENGVITPKLDVFALGVIILELLSGKKAANGEKNEGEELLSASIKGVLEGDNVREKLKDFIDPSLRPEYPLDLAFSMAQLAKICVAHDINARPSMSEVLVTLSKILSSSLDWDPSDEFQRSTSLSSAR